MIRRLGLPIVVAIMLCGAVVSQAPEPSAAAGGIRVHEYNIKSASRDSVARLYAARSYLHYAVNANNSWYVAVIEACYSTGRSSTATSHRDRRPSCMPKTATTGA